MTAKSAADLNTEADTNLADNTSGDISAADVRGAVKDLADSMLNPTDQGGTTGSGKIVLQGSPALTTPDLGTPSAATLTNATGLPIGGGTTGTLAVNRGGTGQTSYTDGQLLIGNTTGNTLSKATLTAGTNITITNGHGSIQIDASGGGTPGGSDTQVQFNDGGAFGGDSGLTYVKGTKTLTTGGPNNLGGNTIVNGYLGDSGPGNNWLFNGSNAYVTNFRLVLGGKFAMDAGYSNGDVFLSRKGAANFRIGDADAASPVAQTLSVQGVAAGTSNTSGAATTIQGSQSTGTGVGGDVIIQTSPAGSTGTSQNAFATGLTVKGTGSVAVGNAALATNATDGFLYIPTCAGTPTGTPATITGRVPIIYDTTNHKLYVYDGGWKGGTAPGAWS